MATKPRGCEAVNISTSSSVDAANVQRVLTFLVLCGWGARCAGVVLKSQLDDKEAFWNLDSFCALRVTVVAAAALRARPYYVVSFPFPRLWRAGCCPSCLRIHVAPHVAGFVRGKQLEAESSGAPAGASNAVEVPPRLELLMPRSMLGSRGILRELDCCSNCPILDGCVVRGGGSPVGPMARSGVRSAARRARGAAESASYRLCAAWLVRWAARTA